MYEFWGLGIGDWGFWDWGLGIGDFVGFGGFCGFWGFWIVLIATNYWLIVSFTLSSLLHGHLWSIDC